MSAPDPSKIQKFREHLHEEWTGHETVAAWRKWHDRIAIFTRGATEAILETAHLRPGLRVLDLASGVGDPALSIAAKVKPSGRVTRSEEHTSELQSQFHLVCRLLLETKNKRE